MEQNYRSLQNENYQLREYILNLQSRLLETQSDIPPAPSHVNLASSSTQAGPSGSGAPQPPEPAHMAEQQQQRREMPYPGPPEHRPHEHDAMSQLQAAAAAASAEQPHHESPYGLGAPADYSNKRPRIEEETAQGGEGKPAL